MSTASLEQAQPENGQNAALQRLATTREEVILLSHMLQASLVVERNHPRWSAFSAHRDLIRSAVILLVIGLSVVLGLVTPSITSTLR